MPSASRLVRSLWLLAFAIAYAGPAFAASANLEQVRNGVATAPVTPTPSWGTGNAGASNSHYLESHSIAYRTVMDGLPTDGTVVELIIGYDLKRSGSYAIDYLTQYQRLLPHVMFGHKQPEVFDPLIGVAGVDPTITTAAIPLPSSNLSVDPDGAESEPAALQPLTSMSALPGAERVMTLFGGTLLDVTYVTEANVDLATKSSETQVKVRFTANSPHAVLAWGGHIACRWDWGFNPDATPRSAGGISGSSYHMRLINWNLGSLGSQDRSMSTDAVYPVPRCGISNSGPFCAGTTNVHTAPDGMETYLWTLFDNTSGASIVGSDTGTSVTVQSGTGGSYGLLLTTGASGFTKQCQTTVTVTAPLVANAGADQVACASSPQVQLQGWVSAGTSSWTGGTGTFNPSRAAVNAMYTPSASEVTAGSVTLTLNCTPPAGTPCPGTSDQVRIDIQRAATANAGADQVLCAGSPVAQLAGTVGGSAIGGQWSGGAGSFSPSASAMNATYTPTAAEIAAGSVTLTLTSVNASGPCPPVGDTVKLTFNPSATVNAGADQTVCASAPQTTLAGQLGGGAATGTWSGGGGSYSPNASTPGAVYTPSAAEIAAGGVTLTFTTNDPSGPCGAVSDAMRITINAAATVNAGADQTVCASAPQVTLAGLVGSGATGGSWSGGTGSFNPSAASLNAVYTPSTAEIAAGGVTLTLTTNDPAGPCGAVSDGMRITINPAATANAGADQRVCASSPQVQLAGSVGGGAGSGTWSGGGGSYSPNNGALNATYTPSAAEIAAGSVTLTLTSNDPTGPCGSVTDQVKITIDPVTVVQAGADQQVCSSSPQVQLHGAVSGTVTSGSWTGGTGVFNPGRSALNATYTPSAAEIAAGTVTLTLTSSASSGPCPPASDAMTIQISQAQWANAGPDQTVCSTSPTVRLAGSRWAYGGTWSGGGGTFSPNANTLNALYTPTAAEIAAGGVTLTLTTLDPAGPCGAASDQMRITFDAPTVTVADRTVCDGVRPMSLCASPGKGVAPFTYLWSNGATGQCISVADTGSYSVTITDALGCTGTGRGGFRWRDCVGMLAHTITTCESYQAGTGSPIEPGDVHWATKDNVISTISPGVFFYFTKIDAPSSDFTVDVVQTVDNPAFPFIPVLQDQVTLNDGSCTTVNPESEATNNGQTSVHITGAKAGQVYIIAIKYSLKSLVGVTMLPNDGAHYDFLTEINGQVVDQDPDGLQIGAPHVVSGGNSDQNPDQVPDPGPRPASLVSEADRLELYRPTPNPFRSGMRMAYEVSGAGQRVLVSVYDLAGRRVKTLRDGFESAGRHLAQWDGRDEAGARAHKGVYFVHVQLGGKAVQVRVTFLD